MSKAVFILIACGFLILSAVGQSTPQNVPQCPPSPDDTNYAPDNMVRPKYPKDALRNSTAGTVDLKTVITPDGKMKELAIIDGDLEFLFC